MITDGTVVCTLCGEWMSGCSLCGVAPTRDISEELRAKRAKSLRDEREFDAICRAMCREADERRGIKW